MLALGEERWVSLLDKDGLHLGPEGHAFVARAVLAAIARAFPELGTDALPQHLPLCEPVGSSCSYLRYIQP